ncbi:MAG: hypothetical protein JXQ72_07815, partial [Anaerolineae bacterium]|nr:hypothetical protein [Anaerolineae bacterium]
GAFSQLVVALSAASQGIKTHKETGTGGPPILIFIGTNPIVELASTAIEQDQYGGVGAHLCASHDEALALAREKLSEPDEKLPESDEKSPD